MKDPIENSNNQIEYLEHELVQAQAEIDDLKDELHCVRAYNDDLLAEIERLKQSSNRQANGG